ncbi:MAG: MFS transporter [Candidatus Thorarchaeota archaeon]
MDVRRNVRVLSAGNTIVASVNSLWIMFMPYFFADMGLEAFQIGLIFTLFAIVRALASLAGGNASDKKGRKLIIGLGFAIYTSGPLIILGSLWFSSSSLLLMGMTAIAGYAWMMFGSGFGRPALSMLLIESSPEKQRGLSYMIATRFLPSIPPSILILVGTALYGSNLFWLGLLLGFVGLLTVLLMYVTTLRETFSGREQDQLRSVTRARGMPYDWFLILFVLAFALDGISSSGLSWYVPLFLGRSELDLYGLMISISTIVIALSALVSGELVDRLGSAAAIAGGWTLLALTVIVFPFASSPFEVIFLYSVWAGLDMVDISVPPLVIADRYSKEKRTSILGAFNTTISLASMVGPAIISFALLLGDSVPFVVKALMNLGGVAIFILASKRFYSSADLQSNSDTKESW